jgi:hypothetical protein
MLELFFAYCRARVGTLTKASFGKAFTFATEAWDLDASKETEKRFEEPFDIIQDYSEYATIQVL